MATNLGVFLHMHVRRRLRQTHQACPLAAHAQQVTIEADPAAATNLLRHMYGLTIMLPLRQVPELLLLADMYQVWGMSTYPVWRTLVSGVGERETWWAMACVG